MTDILVHKAIEPSKLSDKVRAAWLKNLDGGWLQPKYDGVYAQIVYGGDVESETRGWRAYSRTGEWLLSVSPTLLHRAFEWADHNRRFMGELWVPGLDHPVINGRARKQSAQYLELILFDSFHSEKPEEIYAERLARAAEVNGSPQVSTIQSDMLGWRTVYKEQGLEGLYELAAIQKRSPVGAFDGLVWHDPDGLFIPGAGRGGETIKIKPRHSGDFTIVGTTPGIGNRLGGIGAVIVSLGGGRVTEVGAGLSMGFVHDTDPKEILGKIMEVEYLSITPAGKLREPSAKGIRWDKTVGDTLEFTKESRDD